MCAITSYEIFLALHRKKILAKFCVNKYHAFVMVGDIVIDVTATQFDSELPEVVISEKWRLPKKKSWAGAGIWTVTHQTSNPKRIKSLLKDWPTEQQPVAMQKGLL